MARTVTPLSLKMEMHMSDLVRFRSLALIAVLVSTTQPCLAQLELGVASPLGQDQTVVSVPLDSDAKVARTSSPKNYIEWRAQNGLRPLPMPRTYPPVINGAYDLDVVTMPKFVQYSEYANSTVGDIGSRCVDLTAVSGLVPPTGWVKLFTKRLDFGLTSNNVVGIRLSLQINIDSGPPSDGAFLLCQINPVDRYGNVDESQASYCAATQFFPNLLRVVPSSPQLATQTYGTFVTRPNEWPGTT
ncbi:hypothetical protein EG829_24950, partial [bacterium]|nr:hypothetical protein [bacterium]